MEIQEVVYLLQGHSLYKIVFHHKPIVQLHRVANPQYQALKQLVLDHHHNYLQTLYKAQAELIQYLQALYLQAN